MVARGQYWLLASLLSSFQPLVLKQLPSSFLPSLVLQPILVSKVFGTFRPFRKCEHIQEEQKRWQPRH